MTEQLYSEAKIFEYFDIVVDDICSDLYTETSGAAGFLESIVSFSECRHFKLVKNPYIKSIFFVSEESLSSKELLQQFSMDEKISLALGNRSQLCYILNPNESITNATRFTKLLHQYLKSLISFQKKNNHENEYWEEIFSAIPFPCALLNSHGEILVHNPPLAKLNLPPSDLMSFKHQEKIEIMNVLYNVHLYDIKNSDEKAFILIDEDFFATENQVVGLGNSTSEELGIITSSMAHELNNPIAAITTGIAVLELGKDRNEIFFQALQDMKVSARRCKELIEVFLGFSRRHPSLGNEETIISAFNRAVELIRSRIIESDIWLDISVTSASRFQKAVNPSIMTMIFYLILSESLTSFSHLRLLYEEQGEQGFPHEKKLALKISLKDSSHKINITTNRLLNFDHIEQSKLLRYLLKLENLDVCVRDGAIEIEYLESECSV